MATEKTNIAGTIVQTVAEAARVMVQAMVAAGAEHSTRHEGTN